MRRLIALAPLGALLALGVLFGVWSLRRDPDVHPDALVGKLLPPSPVQPLAGGEAAPLDEMVQAGRGGPLVLNVFASWCAPCRLEAPNLLRLQKAGVRIVGLAWKDDPAATRAMLAETGNPFALVLTDRAGAAAIDLGVTGVPETYLVDRRGVVVAKLSKPLTPGDADRIARRMAALP